MSMSSALKLVSQQMTLRTEGEIMLKGLMLSISLQEGQTFHPTFSVPGSSETSGLTYYQLGSPNQTKNTKKFKSLIGLDWIGFTSGYRVSTALRIVYWPSLSLLG